jgi:hypothetical protein
MTLRLSKNKVVLLIIFFILFLGSGLFLMLRDGSDMEKIEQYSDILKDCNIEQNRSEKRILCPVLLINEWEEGESRCFDFFIYRGLEEELREVTICPLASLVSWENPYGEYEALIPVNLEMTFRRDTLRGVVLELMSSSEESEVASHTVFNSAMFNLKLKRAQEEVEAGYFFSKLGDSERENLLHINQAFIYGVEVEGDDLLLYVKANINGSEVDFAVRREEFGYLGEIPVFDEEDEEERVVEFQMVNPNNYEEFSFSGEFSFLLRFEIEVEEVVKYIESLEAEISRDHIFLRDDLGPIYLRKILTDE